MSTIYTIGYEGTDIERFVRTLKTVGVTTLADVRDLPLSRKRGFSKNALRNHLEIEGINYIHLKQLGDPKAGREAARRKDFAGFRRIFEHHISTAESNSALRDLSRIARGSRTCMMCFERNPIHCHRTIVAQRLAAFGYVAFDLFVDHLDSYEQHPDRLPSDHFSQSIAAAE